MKTIQVFALLLATLTCSLSQTVVTVINQDPDLSLLSTLIQATNLDTTLEGAPAVTVFAPVNSAIESLPATTIALLQSNLTVASEVLLYHVTLQTLPTSSFVNDALVDTASPNGDQIRTNVYMTPSGTIYTVNGATIISTNDTATNGLVHSINKVMFPPTSSISQFLSTNPDYSILYDYLVSTGLINALNVSATSPATLFAPTNTAFQTALPDYFLAQRQNPANQDNEQLKQILLLHVVGGTLFSAGIYNSSSVPSVQGENITFTIDPNNQTTINGYATIIGPDWIQTDGVVHTIDSLLVPTFTILQINELFNLTTLNDGLAVANLSEPLNQADAGPFTEFGPTNQAFESLPPATIVAIQSNLSLLVDVLTYHVYDGALLSTDLVNDQSIVMVNGDKARINIYDTPNSTVTYTINCKRIIAGDYTGSNGVVHIINDVLLPPELTISQTINGTSDLSTLYSALMAADLTSLLASNGSFTIFAPTNAAFEALGTENVNKVIGNVTLLQQILTYHVVPSTYCSGGLYNGLNLTSAEGSTLSMTESGGNLRVNGATVIVADNVATNGVLHQIDAVLIPPGVDLSGETTSTGSTGTGSGTATTGSNNDSTTGNGAAELFASVVLMTTSLIFLLL